MQRKIKLVVFDLDGVLLDAKRIHFDALNAALEEMGEEYVISESDHIAKFDGLPTETKLELLYVQRGLPMMLHHDINMRKQEFTLEQIHNNVHESPELIELMWSLKAMDMKIAVASNSVYNTVRRAIINLGIHDYIDLFLSNEDVMIRKPNPSIYNKCMNQLCFLPKETLVVEDSPVGLRAAYASGAYVLQIHNVEECNARTVGNAINNIELNNYPVDVVWQNKKMNVLIPMAGAGNRFAQQGYKLPKPLIDVNGQPMIKRVVDSLNIDANYIFICQQSHFEKYNLETVLKMIRAECKIVCVDGVTDGAARTTLLAKDLINSDDPLLIVNSDQILDFSSTEFLYNAEYSGVDGSIITFQDTHPKWSYARLDPDGIVVEVAEKNPISTNATVGVYYWKHGKDYVESAEQMIANDIRTNNEFYVCPSFNEAITNGKRIKIYNIPKECMHGVGTPEDLQNYLGETNG